MRWHITKYSKKKSILCAFSILLIFLSSCSSTSQNFSQEQISDKQIQQIQQLEDKMFANDKPETHFDDIREYVFEQYPDLPDEVELLVKNTNPKVVFNKIKMEYSFFWVLPDGSILEVVTTPPPLCDPIGIHHSKQLKYE
ncbi:MAG TPA: hypothetical protein DD381_01700 [Lentisphaeria bacterium]|nr:MAG: hypothetical protein A2X47_10330 [Lentisphaerae bacterium GWF2_38_69]HBM15056.1 hypothetical protein [Lentisphaeria bacterium]